MVKDVKLYICAYGAGNWLVLMLILVNSFTSWPKVLPGGKSSTIKYNLWMKCFRDRVPIILTSDKALEF